MDGQYYGCNNEQVKPKRVFQYILADHSLRQVFKPNNESATVQLWKELVSKLPDVDDCNLYQGYVPPTNKKKRAIIPMVSGDGMPVASTDLGLICSQTCSPDGARLLSSNNCHTIDQLFKNNRMIDNVNEVHPSCIQELLISCSSLLEFKYCPGIPYTYPCPLDIYNAYKTKCLALYDQVFLGSTLNGLYKGCSFWKYTANAIKCNNQRVLLSAEKPPSSPNAFDSVNVLYSFLRDDELTPIPYDPMYIPKRDPDC